jgi:hypothetical protein
MRSRRASHSRGLIAAVVDEAARRLVDDVQMEVSMDINRVRGFMKTRDVKTLYRLEQSLSKAKDDLVELRYMMTHGAPA